jgi:hypothetical protein
MKVSSLVYFLSTQSLSLFKKKALSLVVLPTFQNISFFRDLT